MAFGGKPQGKTYQPYVTTDDDAVVVKSISKKGNDFYVKFSKRGSIFAQERYIGSATGKGAKIGSVLGTTYRVEWERD